MSITKRIISFAALIIISSCSHIKLDTPKNDVTDIVVHKGQKYLIPIPKGYCRYNSKDKGDKAVINFVNDFHKAEYREIVALYEESCEVKQKVINGDLRDSPRSIEVDVGFRDMEYDNSSRQEFVNFLYKNTPKKLDYSENKKSLTKIYDDTTEEKLLQYGFSKKRSDSIREDFKGYAERNNSKQKLEKDDNAFYLFYFGSSNNVSSYSVQSFTRIYNKNISVIITRTLDNLDYDRYVAKQILEEAKAYMKDIVSANDNNDYKEYSKDGQKIKIFRPKNFMAPSKEMKTLTAKFNEVKFINPKDRNFKESFIKFTSNDETIKLGVSLPYYGDIKEAYLASKENYIDAAYKTLRNSFPSRAFNASKEKNASFFMMCDDNNICEDDSKKHEVLFLVTTLIKKTPVLIIAEISTERDKKPIRTQSISSLKEDIIEYIDLMDLNQ